MEKTIAFNSAPSPHDIRCSATCGRSAISAFVFCAVGVILFTLLEEHKALEAYLKYLAFRGDLRAAIERQKEDACLKKIESRIGKEKFYASRLVDIGHIPCELPPQTKPSSPKSKKIERSKGKDVLPPVAPTGLFISSTSDEPQKVADLIDEFLKSGNLGLAKRLSYSSKYSIDRWIALFGRRIWIGGSRPEVSADGNWAIPKGDLFKYFTLRDILDLDALEFPNISNIDTFQTQLRVQVPSIPISSDLGTGAMLTQFGLLLSVGYFLLYQTESRHSATFPASGTFFAIFNRTPTRNAIFLFLAASPPIVSFLITTQSQSEMETLVSWFITSLVILICVQIAYGEAKARHMLYRQLDI
jgi:hypothetical protein